MNAYTENGLIFTKRENGAYFSVRAANNNIRSANIPQYMLWDIGQIFYAMFSTSGRIHLWRSFRYRIFLIIINYILAMKCLSMKI